MVKKVVSLIQKRNQKTTYSGRLFLAHPFLLFRLRGSFPFSASEDRVPLILPLPPKQCYQTRGQKNRLRAEGGKVPSPRKGDVNLESTKRNIQQFFCDFKREEPKTVTPQLSPQKNCFFCRKIKVACESLPFYYSPFPLRFS